MDDAAAMRVRYRFADAQEPLDPLGEVEVVGQRAFAPDAFAYIGEDLLERATFDELHRVGGLGLERVHRHDVRVVELRGDLDFGAELRGERRLLA